MKIQLYIMWVFLCLAILFSGCTRVTEIAKLDVSGNTEITLVGDASEGTITFTTNKDWSAKTSEEWLTVNPASGSASDQPVTITVSCDANPGAEAREAVVRITAGGVSRSVTVRQEVVIIPVTGIELNLTEALLKNEETLQLTATVYPDNATYKNVIWSTELYTKRQNKAVTVSQDGLVTATEIGKIFVVATCGGCQARCLITVYENIAIYAYDGLEWGNIMLYGYGDGGTEAAAWPGIRYDDKVEINGYQFYKFVLGPDWFLQGLRLVFNDGGNNRTADYTNTWSYGDYYSVHVTGPFNEDGYATPVNIDNPYLFDPQPYNPDPNPFVPPEDALYYEGFPDTGEWVSGWTFLDVDGDGYNWESGDDITGHDGISGVLCSMSFDVTNRVALTPDNWAFTPAVQLSSEDNYLSFWLCGQDASYPKEHYAVYVTEAIPIGGNIASQCTILLEGTATQSHTIYTKAQSTWEHYSLHIPASFAGRQVYFGFRHFNTTDQFIIDVDDVLVTTYPVEQE